MGGVAAAARGFSKESVKILLEACGLEFPQPEPRQSVPFENGLVVTTDIRALGGTCEEKRSLTLYLVTVLPFGFLGQGFLDEERRLKKAGAERQKVSEALVRMFSDTYARTETFLVAEAGSFDGKRGICFYRDVETPEGERLMETVVDYGPRSRLDFSRKAPIVAATAKYRLGAFYTNAEATAQAIREAEATTLLHGADVLRALRDYKQEEAGIALALIGRAAVD
ncbi:MAG: hypothetical protein V1820_03030 [archaeon]